jgi:ABC-type transport system involved in cytochrome bd biosynthesis fused ATPase/permease subunit
VTPRTPRSPIATYRAPARAVGATLALAGLALAVASAASLASLAANHVGAGLALLAAVTVSRWLLGLVRDESAAAWSTAIRSQGRRDVVGHLRRPRRAAERSRGDLALAIEQASFAPELEVLATGARVAIVGLVVVFWSVGWLATVIVIALAAFAVPLYQRAGRRSAALELEYRQRRAVLESRQLELLHHAPELRALGAVAHGASEIAAISDAEHGVALRAIRVALGSSLVTEFLSGVSVGLVAMVVGFSLLDGRVSLLRALIAVLATSELFAHVRRFGVEFHRREDAAAAAAALSEAPVTVAPAPDPLVVWTDQLVTAADDTPRSISLGPGDRLLVTGPSGSGKTTLLQTLLGWRPPGAGRLARTDRPVGYVSPESALVSGSLWDNLTLGADVDESIVHQLLADLGLSGPRFGDLSEPLLADGRGLSGGERVRLVLARALLARPALVILDDIAGVLDLDARAGVARTLDAYDDLAIIEATVDSPVLADAAARVALGS